MCGRYVRRGHKQRIADAFHVRSGIDSVSMPPDDFNIAPSTFQPVIRESREDGSREMVLMRWGLIPFFTKQLSDIKGLSTINAKAETIRTNPRGVSRLRSDAASFRQAPSTNGRR